MENKTNTIVSFDGFSRMRALFNEFLKPETNDSSTYDNYKNSDDPETAKAAIILEAAEKEKDAQIKVSSNNSGTANTTNKTNIKNSTKLAKTPKLEKSTSEADKEDVDREI